jgi:serine protease
MRKRTVFIIFLSVLLVFLASCIPINNPPTISIPDKTVDEGGTLSFSLNNYAKDPDGDTLTFYKFSGVGNIAGSWYTYNPGYADEGIYYVTIQVSDGMATAQSTFKITVNDVNRDPNTPSLPDPSNNEDDVSVDALLSWWCTDPDGDSLVYDVYFGKTTNPGIKSTNQSSIFYDPGTLDPDTTYYWKVKAKDGKGGETVGPLWSFTTEGDNNPPNQPSNPSPANGSVDQSINTNLSWTCSDPDGDSLTYDIYFGTSSNPPAVYYGKTSANYDPGTLDYDETYYWKIVARDGNGASTEGQVWHFSTEADNYPPETPYNPLPTNGSVDVSINTNLSWNCSDPDGDSLVYNVYFGESSSPPEVSSDQLSKSYDPGTLEEGKTYYWKIKAKDGNGGETTGPVWHFTTEGSYHGEIYGNVQPYDGYVTSSNEILDYDLSNFSNETSAEYIEGEYIVGINREYSLKKALTTLKENEIYNMSYSVKGTLEPADKSFAYMLIESELSLNELKNELKNHSWFKNIERNYIYKTMDVYEPEVIPEIYPNDTYFDNQWHYETINLPAAWSQTTGSINVVVAVLDTGVRFDHPDLDGVFWETGYDFVDDDLDPTDPGTTSAPDDLSHGTHVAGTIAALSNNYVGVAGVNWGGSGSTKILPIRILGPDGGSSFNVAQGIVYAVEHGAKVINMSIGSTGPSSAVENACLYGYDNDVILVAAAGNDNSGLRYPAKYSETFAVGAVRYDWQRAYYSNYGPELDFVAPGGDITVDQNGDSYGDGVLSTSWSIDSGNGYFYMQGTSMAAPHVAGVIALMISNGLTGVEEIRDILKSTARDLGDFGFDNYYGYGLIDAYSAVTYSDGWEPLMVYNTDTMWNVDSVSVVNPDGSYNLQVNLASSYVFVWQDFDHDDDIGYGDLYGYYGYSGGDPDDDYPSTVSVTAGGETEANFEFGVYIDQTYKPVENFDKVIEKKEQIIKEHYQEIR